MADGPVRTCVGCRRRRAQKELIRVARCPDGTVAADLDRRWFGRGAHLCRDDGCIDSALASGRLGRALRFKGTLPDDLRRQLLHEVER